MRRFTVISFLAFFAFLVPPQEIAFAEGGIVWDPKGKPICTASGNQQNIKMAPDGSGGAIIVWEDWRTLVQSDIYAQRIDKNGNPKWNPPNGVAVCTDMARQEYPVIVSDGSGGAIIAWEDRRAGEPGIYAQKIRPDGLIDWAGAPYGVVVSSNTAINMLNLEIVTDDAGGAIIVWQENIGSNWWIRARRIGFNGNLLWVGAQTVSQGTEPKEYPKIISDGMGYVIITWQDFRNTNWDIYVQKLKITDGMTPIDWKVNGSSVTVAALDQINPQIASDGSGGAIIAWTDSRNGNSDIYAQQINSSGVRVWDVGGGDYNGIPICNEMNEQINPVIMNDLISGATTGAIIAWEDMRSGNSDIYAEKVPLNPPAGWTGSGKAMATGNQIQKCPRLVSDNLGGGIITWRENDFITDRYKIFASKRNQNGDPVWSIYPGVLVCQASNIVDHQIVTDGSLGVIIAWQSRPSSDYNIYAQRISEDSISGRVTLSNGEKGIAGVEVEALKDGQLVSSVITDTNGYYGLTGLIPDTTYTVRANWMVNDIESSVSMETIAPSNRFDFTLEIDYVLGTIAGNVSGVEREAKRVSASGFKNSLSPGNGTAFVELEQRGKVMVKVPLEMDGGYSIPNLLPGRFIARAHNGSIYSNSRTVNLKEGETLRVDFAFGIMPEETVFNYPNPAKDGSTTIRYYCGYTEPEAEIKIYNIAGELVRKVEDNEVDRTAAPIYSFLWDCKNSSGKEVASGIYIYAVEVKEKAGSESKKVVKSMAVIR